MHDNSLDCPLWDGQCCCTLRALLILKNVLDGEIRSLNNSRCYEDRTMNKRRLVGIRLSLVVRALEELR